MNPAILQARKISKAYGRTPALRTVSATIGAGEIVAVTGASGSGKSTLLHCLAGILTPDTGEVAYAGRVISTLSERERSRLRRTSFGVLFQFGQLVSELTAAENIALPLLLTGVRRRAALERAREWLRRMDLAGSANAAPGQLSGGQVQRVALARALAAEPDVLFADEPTGALDSLAGEQMLLTLTNAVRERGASAVLVTHDAAVASYADREIVLRDGEVETASRLPAGEPTGAPR